MVVATWCERDPALIPEPLIFIGLPPVPYSGCHGIYNHNDLGVSENGVYGLFQAGQQKYE